MCVTSSSETDGFNIAAVIERRPLVLLLNSRCVRLICILEGGVFLWSSKARNASEPVLLHFNGALSLSIRLTMMRTAGSVLKIPLFREFQEIARDELWPVISNELLGNAMSREMTFKLLDDVDRGCTSQMVELEEITKIVHSHKVTFSI